VAAAAEDPAVVAAREAAREAERMAAVRVQQALAALDPDRMTPMEALVALARLKQALTPELRD
jgi:hypothetical protein